MRKTWMIAAAAAVTMVPLAAHAANWYRVTVAETATWYVDVDTIRKNGEWTAARQYAINFEVSKQTGVKSAWSDVEIDCKARHMRYLHFAANDANGFETVSMPNPDQGKLHPIEPGSVAAVLADFVCNVSRTGAVKVADPKTDIPPR